MFYQCTWCHQTLRLVEWTKERKRHKHRNQVSISTSRTNLIISRGTYFFPDQSCCLPNMPGPGHMSTGYIISWNQTAGRCSLSCRQVLLFVTRTRSPTSESSSLLIWARQTGTALGALSIGKMNSLGRNPSPSNKESSNTKACSQLLRALDSC